MEVRQRRERGCGLFLSCENQIFLKLPRQWLAGKAATGRVHRLLHTQFNPSQTAWHPINQAFISTDPKKLYFHAPAFNWAIARPLLANSRDGGPPTRQGCWVAPPTRLTHGHALSLHVGGTAAEIHEHTLQRLAEIPHRRDAARARQHISATLVSLK